MIKPKISPPPPVFERVYASSAVKFRTVDHLVAKVTALFERLVAELPAGTAAVLVRQVAAGTLISVKPTNPASADFGVHADDFELFSFGFGPRSQWEFPWERRYRNGEKDILTEIEEMSRAVIAGNCELRRGPFWLTGKIHVGDYAYKVTDLPMFPIPPFSRRYYAPFVPPSEPVAPDER
ncbi:MAG TPA: hypothetical protein VF748_14165 [Candidatus Acidoferrum sp.]